MIQQEWFRCRGDEVRDRARWSLAGARAHAVDRERPRGLRFRLVR